MKHIANALIIVSTFAFASQTQAQYHQQKGTVLGGLTGAAAGAIIGDNSGEAGVGAAIGGVVGAVAGSVLGNAQDQQARNYYAAQQQQMIYQQSRAVSLQDVVGMAQTGVSDGVIITAIQNRGVQRPLEVNEIVYLSQSGVSDTVIRSMQQAGFSGPVIAPPAVIARPAPTVVIQRYPGPRYYGYGPRYLPPRPCHHGVHGPIYTR